MIEKIQKTLKELNKILNDPSTTGTEYKMAYGAKQVLEELLNG